MAKDQDTPPHSFPQFLRSPIFTIIIRVPAGDEFNATPAAAAQSSSPSGDGGGGGGVLATASDTTTTTTTTISYTMHKALLASLSPELARHVDNEMREGATNSMHLRDVLPDTFERFAEWAYTGDYPAGGLREHARLFVLGERFNVRGLRRLSRERIAAALEAPGERSAAWWAEVADAWATVFEGVPVGRLDCETGDVQAAHPPAKEADDVEMVLRLVVRYSLAHIKSLRREERFRELVAGNAEFALALVDGMGNQAGISSLDGTVYEQRLSKETWRCGYCLNNFAFGQAATANSTHKPYRRQTYCHSCGYTVGPTLANS